MSEQITPEYLREWERRLGPARVREAMEIVQGYGWPRGSQPPLYVWAEAYRMVEQRHKAADVDAAVRERVSASTH